MTSSPDRQSLGSGGGSQDGRHTKEPANGDLKGEERNGTEVDPAESEGAAPGDGNGVAGPNGDGAIDQEYQTMEGQEEGLRLEKQANDPLGSETARPDSPGDSLSTPDDLPSIQGSNPTSPRSSAFASPASGRQRSPTPSLRPFDRRFSARLSSSQWSSPRAGSPAFLNTHSRQSSISSNILGDTTSETDSPLAPWEVVRWTKLKKITNQAFSEAGKRNFGRCTCIAVSVVIALGTSKGIILIFDYHQTLKAIIGHGTKATESGAVTSIAVSADHSTVAGGHANGSIFTWDIAKSAKPFLQIPPMQLSELQDRKSDGHVTGVAIIHLGFLGTRHTALVSADDRGMAFSHLATRGLGAAGRSVKTQRVLGRYPIDVALAGSRPRKPSSVLAFSPLPLGNAEQVTDTMGLVAMLTPYLLVIVSTTPIAQTQHKASRPKQGAAHSVLSGCLAWFPSVKLKTKDPQTKSMTSRTKLVYCWSNILTVLEVDEVPSSEPADREKPPSLSFRARSRWKAEEAIVAVQWLSRSVLAVLTVTQQLMILEDNSLKKTDSFDLIHKRILHEDVFSKQLQPVVELPDDEGDVFSMHGVVADAFYTSFRTYRGRIFLLGFDDISVGSLSNWMDRLDAHMDAGNLIEAIRLVTSYYNGETDKVTISLPEDDDARHALVKNRLIETISGSLIHTFEKTHVPGIGLRSGPQLHELADACFTACISVDDTNFLFDDVFSAFEEANSVAVFLEALEPHILGGRITYVPPVVLKDLIGHYSGRGLQIRLEDMICQLDTSTMDIDQITGLCKQYALYDALVYVWTQAIEDYVTPVVDLLSLVTDIRPSNAKSRRRHPEPMPSDVSNAARIFPYLSYTFTGRIYPIGAELAEPSASSAKASLYSFIFSGKSIPWPKHTTKPLLTLSSDSARPEPSFPYLRLLLQFDAPTFLEALNEAFEDPFLNGPPETNGHSSSAPSLSINRQYIITILLEVLSDPSFSQTSTIYLDMFIARNLPKYPQYILLSGTALHRTILNLCNHPVADDLDTNMAEDCQLSVEYLLSIYHPPDLASLIPVFHQAHFYRVLKSIYKSEQQYPQLLETYLADPNDQDAIFDCIGDLLRPRAGLTERQTLSVRNVIQAHARDLACLNPEKAAMTIQTFAPELHQHILASLADDNLTQYHYLKPLLEPPPNTSMTAMKSHSNVFIETYLRLLCLFAPTHIADFIHALPEPTLNLESILPALESSGVVDGSVVLMAREGQVQKAMKRLTKHLSTLEAALLGLLDGSSDELHDHSSNSGSSEGISDLLAAVEKYTMVGIWLCQGGWRSPPPPASKPKTGDNATTGKETAEQQRSKGKPVPPPHRRSRSTFKPNDPLTADEKLWLELINTVVRITQSCSPAGASPPTSTNDPTATTLRTLVQRVFTALLTLTSAPNPPAPSASTQPGISPDPRPSFLHILLSFLSTSASTSTLASLRPVLTSIFSTYTYETSLLSLATQLLDADLFVSVQDGDRRRRAGWRAGSSSCEGCGERVWGAGVGGGVWDAWSAAQGSPRRGGVGERASRRGAGASGSRPQQSGAAAGGAASAAAGKSRAVAGEVAVARGPAPGKPEEGGKRGGPLIVFKCGHVWHRMCLEPLQAGGKEDGGADEEGKGRVAGEKRFKCVVCH